MRRIHFWGSALTAAVVLAGSAALLLPYGALGIESVEDKQQAWLLTVWTGGVMAICFGGAGLLTAITPLGFRDVAEAGSVAHAVEARRDAASSQGLEPFFNFAGWMVSAGGFLVAIYFAGWLFNGA